MTRAEITHEALNLPEPERIELAKKLWESLDQKALDVAFPLPQWQKDLLDERLQNSLTETGHSWEAVRSELWPEES